MANRKQTDKQMPGQTPTLLVAWASLGTGAPAFWVANISRNPDQAGPIMHRVGFFDAERLSLLEVLSVSVQTHHPA